MYRLVILKQDQYLKNSKQSISTRLRMKIISGVGSQGADPNRKEQNPEQADFPPIMGPVSEILIAVC